MHRFWTLYPHLSVIVDFLTIFPVKLTFLCRRGTIFSKIEHAHDRHSPEETLALLGYMADHNRQHAQELHELAHSVDGEAAQLLHEAVVDLTVSSEKLAEALRILKGEE